MLKLLFSPQGRIGPSMFMRGAIALIVIGSLIHLLPLIGLTKFGMMGIITIWCWVVLFIKRLHDSNQTGWWSIALLVCFMALAFIANIIVTKLFGGGLTGEALMQKLVLPFLAAGICINLLYVFLVNKLLRQDPNDNQYGSVGESQ